MKQIPIYTIYTAHKANSYEAASGGDGFTIGSKSSMISWLYGEDARKHLQEIIRNRINCGEIHILEQKWDEDGVSGHVKYDCNGIECISWVAQEFLQTDDNFCY